MPQNKQFEVVRQHYGDRMYMPGDTREAADADVAHLVASGVLKATGKAAAAAEKSEPAPQNKAEGAAPANKAATGRKAKGE